MKDRSRTFLLIALLLFGFWGNLFAEDHREDTPKYRTSQLRGFSMYPTIKSGESILYREVDLSEIKLGDIVVFRDVISGERVCHRVVEIDNGRVKSKGDNNRFRDRGFVSKKNLIGKVTHIEGRSVS